MKLGDICKIKYGKDHKKLNDGSIPVYGSGGVMRHVDAVLWNKPSVLIPRKGTLGNLFYVDEPFWTVDTLFWTDIDADQVVPKYLFYQLKTKDLASLNVGTAVPSLTTEVLNEVQIDLPSLEKQKQIVEVLGCIDAKIDANAKLNGYLEELALALYAEYLEWSDEELPVGWVRRPLSDFFPVKTGKKDANIATKNGLYPFFTCGKQNLFTDNYSFDGSAILVAGNGDFRVKWYEGKFEAYQRTYVLMPNDPVLLGYLYCAVKRNLSNITSKSRGSVIKFITKGNIADCEIAVPPIPEMNEIIKHLNQILRVIDANKRDTALLKELRDVLLPKLMSGEIDVSKIDLMQLNSHLA